MRTAQEHVYKGAMLSGARIIIAADILDNKLEMAKTFGATHTINTARDNDPAKKVKEKKIPFALAHTYLGHWTTRFSRYIVRSGLIGILGRFEPDRS